MPVEPDEPVVSAKAAGIEAAAHPIPRAIARAPTRPTCRAADKAGAALGPRNHEKPARSGARMA